MYLRSCKTKQQCHVFTTASSARFNSEAIAEASTAAARVLEYSGLKNEQYLDVVKSYFGG